jgi:hypothetical protein
MPYSKLSDQVRKLTNPQRSDTFVKTFRDAVRDGQFEATDIKSRFELPKQFSKRGSDQPYTRTRRDMIFKTSSAFETWFEEINRQLATARAGGVLKPTLENIEAGLVDFKTLAAETRRKMQGSFDKGQKLGHSRAGAKKPTKRKN